MQEISDLTLDAIDGMRHLVTSEHVVKAIAFAVRHAESMYIPDREIDRTAYRFVVAVAMVGALEDTGRWINILDHILNQERVVRMKERAAARVAGSETGE